MFCDWLFVYWIRSWLSVRGTPFVVICSWYSVRGYLFVVLRSWVSVRGTPFVGICSWYSVRGTPFVVSLSNHDTNSHISKSINHPSTSSGRAVHLLFNLVLMRFLPNVYPAPYTIFFHHRWFFCHPMHRPHGLHHKACRHFAYWLMQAQNTANPPSACRDASAAASWLARCFHCHRACYPCW